MGQNLQSLAVQPDLFIIDLDSFTDFQLPLMPPIACGYTFTFDDTAVQNRTQWGDSVHGRDLRQSGIFSSRQSNSKIRNVHEDIHDIGTMVQRHIHNMEVAYQQHKIDKAYAQVKLIRKIYHEKTHIVHDLTAGERHLMEKVEREMEEVAYFQKIMSQNQWQLKQEKKNIKVYLSIEGHTVGVMVDALLDVEIENFFSVLTEIDLMKKWMPFMEYSRCEKIVSRNCRIGHTINNMPFIAKRESFFQGIGYDRVQHNNTVFLYTKSLNKYKQLQKQLDYQVKETEGAVQLEYKYMILEYVPLTPKSGRIKLALNVDFNLRIPMFILSPAMEGFGVDFYNNILERARNFKGSAWEEKTKQYPEFFTFLQDRIKQHFAHNRP